MPVASEVSRLRRSVDELVAGVEADLRSKHGLSGPDRRAVQAEIEACVQKLDELRTQLSAG